MVILIIILNYAGGLITCLSGTILCGVCPVSSASPTNCTVTDGSELIALRLGA